MSFINRIWCAFIFILVTQVALAQQDNPSTTFTSPEHVALGNTIKLHFPEKEGKANLRLELTNGLKLTYGEILSFGDFYEIPWHSISQGQSESERRAVFLAAFNSFAVNTDKLDEIQKILNTIYNQQQIVTDGMQRGKKAEDIYKSIALDFDREFNCITGGGCSKQTWWMNPGRYLQLASEDYDHFGNNAWISYQTGHEVALEQAIDAHQTGDLKKLEIAYAMNAFASHFLSDRFASGHIRTPRFELPKHTTPAVTGSLLANFMHDEENTYGLHVHNLRGEHWVAYGDRFYYNALNAENMQRLITVLQKSADQIFYAYITGTKAGGENLAEYIPYADEVADAGKQDISPLFYWDEVKKKLYRRKDLANLYDRHWTDDWWGWSTLADLKRQRGLSVEAQASLLNSEYSEQAIRDGLIDQLK